MIALDVTVLEVHGRERLAVEVLEVLDVWGHHVASTARADGLHARHAPGIAEEDHHERKHGETEEEGAGNAVRGAAPSQTAPRDVQDHEVQERQPDPEALRPLIGGADPARRPGDALLGHGDGRRWREPQEGGQQNSPHFCSFPPG